MTKWKLGGARELSVINLMRFFWVEVFRSNEGDTKVGQVKNSGTAVFEPAEISVSVRGVEQENRGEGEQVSEWEKESGKEWERGRERERGGGESDNEFPERRLETGGVFFTYIFDFRSVRSLEVERLNGSTRLEMRYPSHNQC